MMLPLVLLAITGKIVTAYVGSRWFGLSPKVSMRAGFSMVPRGEFSAIIASLALPHLRVFSGIYILITAFVGVYLFDRAPHMANWYDNRWLQRPTSDKGRRKHRWWFRRPSKGFLKNKSSQG